LSPSSLSYLSARFIVNNSGPDAADRPFLTMGDREARDAPPEPAPARPTKRALFNLRLEEMRRRGDPTDDISEPSASGESSGANRERVARILAINRANGPPSEPDPDLIAEQKRQAEFYMARAAERRRQAKEVRKKCTQHVFRQR
jgi:hypothetical protein